MKRLAIVLVGMAIILLLAACGGATDPTPAPVTLNVRGTDNFRFDPANVSASTGAQVTVNFENAGVLEHSWELIGQGVDPLTATEADALPGTSTGHVPAGQTRTITFTAPAPGAYTVVCTVPGHRADHAAGGMVGTMTVNP